MNRQNICLLCLIFHFVHSIDNPLSLDVAIVQLESVQTIMALWNQETKQDSSTHPRTQIDWIRWANKVNANHLPFCRWRSLCFEVCWWCSHGGVYISFHGGSTQSCNIHCVSNLFAWSALHTVWRMPKVRTVHSVLIHRQSVVLHTLHIVCNFTHCVSFYTQCVILHSL